MNAIKVARNGLLSRFFLHPTTLRSFSRLPAEISRYVDNLLRDWRDIERQRTPYTLVPMTMRMSE